MVCPSYTTRFNLDKNLALLSLSEKPTLLFCDPSALVLI